MSVIFLSAVNLFLNRVWFFLSACLFVGLSEWKIFYWEKAIINKQRFKICKKFRFEKTSQIRHIPASLTLTITIWLNKTFTHKIVKLKELLTSLSRSSWLCQVYCYHDIYLHRKETKTSSRAIWVSLTRASQNIFSFLEFLMKPSTRGHRGGALKRHKTGKQITQCMTQLLWVLLRCVPLRVLNYFELHAPMSHEPEKISFRSNRCCCRCFFSFKVLQIK